MPNAYTPGNVVRLTNVMTASGDLIINPTTVHVAVFHTAVESIDVNSVVNPTSGTFYFDYCVETPGILGVRWETSDSHKTKSYHAIDVTSLPWS